MRIDPQFQSINRSNIQSKRAQESAQTEAKNVLPQVEPVNLAEEQLKAAAELPKQEENNNNILKSMKAESDLSRANVSNLTEESSETSSKEAVETTQEPAEYTEQAQSQSYRFNAVKQYQNTASQTQLNNQFNFEL